MAKESVGTRVQRELTEAVNSGLLPSAVQEKAEKLLERLRQPVRLAIMGPSQVGKSTLLNLLVGHEVVPEGLDMPTLQLEHGGAEAAICTLPDGTRKTLDRADPYEIAGLHPVFVEMRMPLPALAKISVLEVVTPNDPTALHKASHWAAKRCDIALWCTHSFGTNEQATWSAMPDLIKDHGFLMLTRADEQLRNGTLDAALQHLRSIAADDFNQVLPIATKDAIAARHDDGSVDRDKFRNSGGQALITSVLKLVELGRQSTVDLADVLLAQNADALAARKAAPEAPAATQTPIAEETPVAKKAPETAPPPKETAEEVTPKTPSAPAKPATPPTAFPVKAAPKEEPPAASSGKAGIIHLRELAERAAARRRAEMAQAEEEMIAPEDIAPEAPEAPEDTVEPATSVTDKQLHPTTRDAFAHVVKYLEEQASVLTDTLSDLGDEAPAEVMALSVDHIQWMCDYLAEHGDASDQILHQMRDAAYDAADMAQLMQMERSDSAAVEAVALMLQMKRELQANLAA